MPLRTASVRSTDKVSSRMQFRLLLTAYVLISVVELLAEFFVFQMWVILTKPLLIPLIAAMYLTKSSKPDFYYLSALTFTWIAGVFFIFEQYYSVFTGAMFFLVYRLLQILVVAKHAHLPGKFPIFVGSMPFLFVYMYFIYLTYSRFENGLVIYILQCLLISVLGGFALGSFVMRSNRANTLLLVSTMCFGATQFIFALKFVVVSEYFQPAAMLLYLIGQYLFFRYILLAENNKASYKIIG